MYCNYKAVEQISILVSFGGYATLLPFSLGHVCGLQTSSYNQSIGTLYTSSASYVHNTVKGSLDVPRGGGVNRRSKISAQVCT